MQVAVSLREPLVESLSKVLRRYWGRCKARDEGALPRLPHEECNAADAPISTQDFRKRLNQRFPKGNSDLHYCPSTGSGRTEINRSTLNVERHLARLPENFCPARPASAGVLLDYARHTRPLWQKTTPDFAGATQCVNLPSPRPKTAFRTQPDRAAR